MPAAQKKKALLPLSATPLLCQNYVSISIANGMILGVRVSSVRSDNVANPSQRPTAANPETWGDNQPKNSGEDAAVVKLANSGND